MPPRPSTRQQRVPCLRVLGLALALSAPAAADEAGPRLPPGAPDLVAGPLEVRRDGDSTQVELEVRNAGSLPSGPTTVRLTASPPLGPAEGGVLFPRHGILPNERALVIWPETQGEVFRLGVRWQGSEADDRFTGRILLEDRGGAPISPGPPVLTGAAGREDVRLESQGWTAWEAATGRRAAGFDLVAPAGATPARFVLSDLTLAGVANYRQVFIGNWWITRYFESFDDEDDAALEEPGQEPAGVQGIPAPGRLIIPLDDPRLARAATPLAGNLQAVQPLPGLSPGGAARVAFRVSGSPRRLFAEVDPDDSVTEIREGNNVSHLKPTSPHGPMVSLHTHASLSEGTASVDTQMDLLARSGYDAVFWTEHDWRVLGTGFQDVSGFEDDPGPAAWRLVPRRLDPGLKAAAFPTQERASEGARSLRLEATRVGPRRDGQPQAAWGIRLHRGRQIRALAQELTLSLDVHPDASQALDSELTLELELSDQPRVKRRLLYRIEASPVAVQVGQAVAPVPPGPEEEARLTVRPGRWTRIVVPVTDHARSLFPEGVDNALTGIQFGLAVWRGSAQWDLDRLGLEAALEGEPLLALQEDWTRHYPGLPSHVTAEISYFVPHLNPFVTERFLLDYDSIGARDYVPRALQETHRRHGALSLNHPLGFGPAYSSRHVEQQLRHRLFGADLVEVGYRFRGGAGLAEHLAFWDQALAAGVPASGIGVTDAHGPGRGNGFARDENNFATWVEADPTSTDSLIDGLLSGRLVFGDPLLFDGSLELVVDGRHRPGAVLLGERRRREVVFSAAGLPAGARLQLVVDGVEVASAAAGEDGSAGGGAALDAAVRFARLAAWDPRGEPLAFTNAILFLDALPPEGLPAARLRMDAEDLRVSGEGRYRLRELTLDSQGLRAAGEGRPGVLILEGLARPPARILQADGTTPLAATFDAASGTLRLPLAGGGLSLRWRRPGPPLPGGWWTVAGLLALLAAVAFAVVKRRRPARSRRG